jgi:hypothetical protein
MEQMNSPHIKKILAIASGIPSIPANEQGIGYLQMAVMEALKECAEEFERIEKVIGLER